MYICIRGQQQNLHLSTGQTIIQSNEYKQLGMKIYIKGTSDEALSEI